MFAALQAEGLGLPDGADEKLVEEVSRMAMARESAVIAPTPEQKLYPADRCQQVGVHVRISLTNQNAAILLLTLFPCMLMSV